ncbi:sulfotransferase family protein [Microbaculum sp. FT89]|uniref:sulfotransferase family protein n=1 Tax=Microbaculum sp. FT89 TaxID=3447298 RepID=UPI003F5390C0
MGESISVFAQSSSSTRILNDLTALCIGAPRSGTTWLYRNLRRHPDIFLPPVKEVRQFVGKANPQVRTRIAETAARDPGEYDALWAKAWAAADRHSEDDYRVLMRGIVPSPVTMDISPVYCIAKRGQIAKFKRALGERVRIVMMLRNPIDRDFSHAKQHFHMVEEAFEARSVETYLQYLDQPSIRRRNNYPETLDLWSEVFGPDAIHVEFYEDIASDPFGVLERVAGHLGVAFDRAVFVETASRRVGAGGDASGIVPAELKPLLAERHRPLIEAMARRWPQRCRRWLDDCDAVMSRDRAGTQAARAAPPAVTGS